MKLFLIIVLTIFALFIFFVLRFASSFLKTINKISYNLKNKKQTNHYGQKLYDKDNIKIYKGDSTNYNEDKNNE